MSQSVHPNFFQCFSDLVKQAGAHRDPDSPVNIDGQSLSIPAVVVVARHGVQPRLVASDDLQKVVKDSREVIDEGVKMQKSIYGVTTGIGASANTRSDDVLTLGVGLLQQLHCGILPTDLFSVPSISSDGRPNKIMPEAWTRGGMLLRLNSMVRGLSGVRWEVIDTFWTILCSNIIPVIPLLGSISASGDLLPLAYVAGSIIGHSRIKVFCGPSDKRIISTSQDALSEAGINAVVFEPKEPLAIVNGTSFSTSVASLAVYDAAQLASLSVFCTAFANEALLGSRGSYASFIHDTARPHPGQVQVSRWILHLLEGSQLARNHDESVRITEDKGILRQDRYALRTFPQFVGPQVEDIYAAIQSLTIECNSANDNPVVEAATKTIHLGGNFQAMSVTNAMEKTRFALDMIAKITFGQSSELLSSDLNKGLAPGLAATDPSVNYHGKGLDVAMASYVAELGFLANPVAPHAQICENANETVNSMALVSARATCASVDILSMLLASHLYILCQAVDLRVMHRVFLSEMKENLLPELGSAFQLQSKGLTDLAAQVYKEITSTMLITATMDLPDQMQAVASATIPVIVKFFVNSNADNQPTISKIASFSESLAQKGIEIMSRLRWEFLAGTELAPAAPYLGRTEKIYKFIRETLDIRMHGEENLRRFDNAPYPKSRTMGENISSIYEAIVDGRIASIVADLVM